MRRRAQSARDLEAADIRPRGCIIGEPTDMDVIVGHKSGSAFTCDVRGREAHAALSPHGVNAIEYAARLVVKIARSATGSPSKSGGMQGSKFPTPR